MRRFVVLSISICCLAGCVTTRQTLTPEAARVEYTEGKLEPRCEMLEEVTVGRQWFVTDERQPAVSRDDVVVRMRRLAAKRGGNYVVILENEPPSAKCDGYSGLGRVYRCSEAMLAELPRGASKAGETAEAAQ